MSAPDGGRFDTFYSLDPNKRQRIIDAALTEFAEKGFKRASTNTIAANAQIGKGMLFYYFGSKEALFDFLCEYTIEFARNEYLRQFQLDTGDFLLRYQKLTEIKRRTMAKWPKIISFFESSFHEANAAHFTKHYKEINALREQVYGSIYQNIDLSLFRNDVDGEAIVRYIKWLFDAYQEDITQRVKRGELMISDETAIEAEWTRFADFTRDLRKVFYKEGK